VLGALEQVEGFVAHRCAPWACRPRVHGPLGAARQVVGQDVQRATASRQPCAVGRKGSADLDRGCADAPRPQEPQPQEPQPPGRQPPGRQLQAPRAARPGPRPDRWRWVTPANVVEAAGAEQIRDDLAAQHATRAELFIDRAYLRPGLSDQRAGPRPPRQLGDLLQGVAGPTRRGGSKTAHGSPRPTSPSTSTTASTTACWSAPPASRWRSPQAAKSSSRHRLRHRLRRLPAARPVHHQHPRAQRADPPPRAAAGQAPSPPAHPQGRAKLRERVAVEHTLATLATGRAAVPATLANARTSSTFAAAPSSTTSTSSPVRPGQTSRPPEHR